MRIAYIVDASSVHCYKWISYFAEKNEVILICAENQNNPPLYKSFSNIKIYPVLPQAYPLRKFWRRTQTIIKLKKIIKQHNIQIIHSIYAVPNAFWAYHLNFNNHIVTTFGSDMLVDYNKIFQSPENLNQKSTYYFLKRLVKKSLNKAKYITSTSLKQQEVIKEFIHNEKKLFLIRTGVDIDKFLKVYESLSKQTDDFIILSNRAVKPLYNIHLIVDAFKLLKEKHPPQKIKLVILKFNVDVEYFKKIIQQVNDYQLQQEIIFIESKIEHKLIQIYKDADMVIMIPSSDGTPVSATEAMLARKPLIVGNLDYDDDLFNKNTVWKINSFSANDICNKIMEVLNSNDKNRKNENAFNAAINLTDLKKEVLKIEELYKRMIG